MFSFPSAAALNHLLAQNFWAVDRLKPLAGKTAQIDVAPFSFAYTIRPDGMLENAASSVPADAQCVIPPSLLPRLALQFDHAKDEIQCRGDASLLAEIFYLSRNLRWDAVDDLSRVTGDLVAERIVRFAQTGRTQMDEGLANLTQGISEYLTEEQPSLATPRHVATFLFQVDTLRDDVSRLEQRISRISSALPTGSVTKVAR